MFNFTCALGNIVERALYTLTQNRQPALCFGTGISKGEINEYVPHWEVSIWLGRVIAGDRRKRHWLAGFGSVCSGNAVHMSLSDVGSYVGS